MFDRGFPVIDMAATGENIKRLRIERGLTVRDLQNYFGFEEPQAIYKWQRGQSLPTVDNLFALGKLLGLSMDEILIPRKVQSRASNKQQEESCCSAFYGLNYRFNAIWFPVWYPSETTDQEGIEMNQIGQIPKNFFDQNYTKNIK